MKYFILYIMNENFLTIGIIILIILSFIVIFYFSNRKVEGWANYERKPLNYLSTGSTPLNFYRKDLYRLPYRYPFTFNKSYPLPNQSYYELL